MMMHGRNNGKKLMTVRIVKHAFEIIHLLTGEVSENLIIVWCVSIKKLKILVPFPFEIISGHLEIVILTFGPMIKLITVF